MAQGKENGRILETIQEEHPAGTSQEWNLVVAPRRRAASDRPPGGSAPDSSPGDRAPVDRAPGDEVQSVTAQTADYRQEFPEDRQKRETKGQFSVKNVAFKQIKRDICINIFKIYTELHVSHAETHLKALVK